MDWDEAYNLHVWDQVRDHLDQIEDEVKFRDYAERSGELVCPGQHGTIALLGGTAVGYAVEVYPCTSCGAKT